MMKNFFHFIQEKWTTDLVKSGSSFPIFVNPSSRDLIDLKKAGLENDLVRFIAVNNTKKLYVFSGMKILHDAAYNQLVNKKIIPRMDISNLDHAFCGECKLINGYLSFEENTGIDSYFGVIISGLKRKQTDNIDSFLLEPYTDFNGFIKDIPMLLKRYEWVGQFIQEFDTHSSLAIIKKLS